MYSYFTLGARLAVFARKFGKNQKTKMQLRLKNACINIIDGCAKIFDRRKYGIRNQTNKKTNLKELNNEF